MSDAPQVKAGDWIKVGSIECVVTEVKNGDPRASELEVVVNPEKPVLYHVNWDGEAWAFAHPMRGEYADRRSRTAVHVDTLKKGWPRW